MRIDSRHLWKALGLAGALGVAATGALAVRAERQRRAYTPDEVRDRLHTRFAQASAAADRTVVELVDTKPTLRQRLSRVLRRR
ncbi:hypothetical protein AB4Z09_00260 [Rhodococcus sp. TAF43]|uniref:hypothetical protein n=1 Tax=unclassified Rhodococcus (in: high G+C Gram-positive bacteria) TaxID=192944 RepID=UPI000E0A1BF3|nr:MULTISPECIES: hypothetical protein [unclassified Rhodococcus (in: high G+C Gram-positive bacteria)]QKT11253.1 hypothetical protein HUN07_11425 [Rhodococcus sp. W8901]RDI31533.1 hypothetical protein DEU38_104247 [Rhodococcus sp. AG1013]